MSAAGRIARELFPTRCVALQVIDAGAIRALNRSFRGIDESTDVLSFTADPHMPAHAGDIALCWDAVLAQAGANGNSAVAEAVALVTHGMLHLAGLDHRDEQEQEAMDRRTRELCRLAGIEVSEFGH